MTKPHLFLGAYHPESQKPVLVRYGESGYWTDSPDAVMAADFLVTCQTTAVTEAALAGSMFGWDCPGAAAAREFMASRMRAWRAEKLLKFVETQLREDADINLYGAHAHTTCVSGPEHWQGLTLEELIDKLPEAKQ